MSRVLEGFYGCLISLFWFAGVHGIIIGSWVGLWSMIPVASAAPFCDSSFVSPVLRVEVDPEIADAQLLPGWIADRNADLVERMPAAPGHDQWISVLVTGTTYDYRVVMVAMRDGVPIVPSGSAHTCKCNIEVLLEEIDGWIGMAVERLRVANEEASEPDSVSEEAGTPDPECLDGEAGRSGVDVEQEYPRGFGPVRYAGLGAGVVGAGALAAGIVFSIRGIEVRPGPEGVQVEMSDTRIAGLALSVGGGVVLATGVTLMVFDTLRRRAHRLTIAPALGSRFTGTSIGGRF